MAKDIDSLHAGCSGVGVLASLSGLLSSGMGVAAFVCFCLPGMAPLSGGLCLCATTTGLGEGVLLFAKKQLQDSLQNSAERSVFHLVAEENALHRQVWQSVQEYASSEDGQAEVQQMFTEAESGDPNALARLQALFPTVDLDDLIPAKGGTVANVLAVKNIAIRVKDLVSLSAVRSSGSLVTVSRVTGATAMVMMPVAFYSVFAAAHELIMGEPTEAAKRLRVISQQCLPLEGLSAEQHVQYCLDSPLTGIPLPPPGIVMFEAVMTTRRTRMVVSRPGSEPSYHPPNTPVRLEARGLYTISFQVSAALKWLDVKERSRQTMEWATPVRPHIFHLQGPPAYRLFSLRGPCPLWVEKVDDEHGPMLQGW